MDNENLAKSNETALSVIPEMEELIKNSINVGIEALKNANYSSCEYTKIKEDYLNSDFSALKASILLKYIQNILMK